MNCSPSGSSVHGIFQARGLEWGTIVNFFQLFYLDSIFFIEFNYRSFSLLYRNLLCEYTTIYVSFPTLDGNLDSF